MNKTTRPRKVPLLVSLCSAAILLSAPWCPAAPIPNIFADPYIGAIAVDGATGKVLFEENADVPGYPASCVKLMDLLIIVEQIEAGRLSLTNPVTITADAMRMGGSQAFLEAGEVFTIDELLYALIVMSGNDAAVALALHVAGSTEGLVQLMNQRARELGMKDTVFSSVHGLPPGKNNDLQPDVSTARDLATLAREVIRHPLAMKYASTQLSYLRQPPKRLEMRTHNALLGTVPGVDGLKTGWIRAGGYSMVVSAKRNNRYVLVAVLGSSDKKIRNAKATEILNKAFGALPVATLPAAKPRAALVAVAPTNATPEDALLKERAATRQKWSRGKKAAAIGLAVVAVLIVLHLLMSYRRNKNLR